MKMNKKLSVFAVAALCGVNFGANAAAFQLKEQNASGLGRAYAGSAAYAEDASIGYYNPAALIDLPNDQMSISGVGIRSRQKFDVRTAVDNIGQPIAGTPTRVKNTNDGLIPGLHFAKKLSDKWAFGFNVVTPFGLENTYKGDSIVRVNATKSKMTTIDITPSVSYKHNDELSFGFGLDMLQTKLELNSKTRLSAANPEGYMKNKADKWSYGFHLGMLYKVSETTKFGLTYHSGFKVKLNGNNHIEMLNTAGLGGGVPNIPATKRNVTSTVKLPDRLTYSVKYDHSEKWNLFSDIEWTHWSRLKEIKLNFSSGLPVTTQYRYKNTFRVALGADYKVKDCWIVKFGAAFDQTPVQSRYRDVRLPDTNRYWLSIGTKYMVNKNITLDAGYSHLFFKRVNIDDARERIATGGGFGRVTGSSKAGANLVGIQVTWNVV